MSVSVNTIKQLLAILFVVLIATYLISLNIETSFLVLNTRRLSNDFLFAIAGGVFASLVVVLACEIIKYQQLKLATEGALFSYMGNLYGQFLIIRGNCKRTLDGHDLVPDNLIQSPCDNAIDCPNVKDALNKVIGQTSIMITYLDQIISQMDDGLDNRYNWRNLRQTLNTYQDNLETKTLADYINEDVAVF